MKIVLASTSKQKNEILNTVHIKHSQIASDFEEKKQKNENVYSYVKRLAYGKAESIEKKCKDSIIIGLDTVCFVKGKILEKPKDEKEEREHIKLCSNAKTEVITGIAIINQKTGEKYNNFAKTVVKMRKISENDVNYYINNEKDWIYASGFIIETILSNFIKKIEGSYYNILGVPVEHIYKVINQMGYSLEDLEE